MGKKKDKKVKRNPASNKLVSSFDKYQLENIKQAVENFRNTYSQADIEEIIRVYNDNKYLIENARHTFTQLDIDTITRQAQELHAQYRDLATIFPDYRLEQLFNTSSVLNPITMYHSSLELNTDQFSRVENKHVYLPLKNSKIDIDDDKQLTVSLDEFKPIKANQAEYSLKTTTTETTDLGNFNLRKIEHTNLQIQNLQEEVTALRISTENDAKKTDEMLQEIFDYIKNGGSSIVKIKKVIYNKKSSELSFGDTVIKIQADSNEDYVCKTLFSSKSSMSKTWEVFDIVEAMGEDPFSEIDWNEKIYNTVRRLNDKIQKNTSLERFILYNNKTLCVNNDYIK